MLPDIAAGAQRSVLQRRNSISNTMQAVADGIAVLGIAYLLIDHHVGVLTADYAMFVLLLMVALALAYDHYAIYRTNTSQIRKVVLRLKAWMASIMFLIILALLSETDDQISRWVVAELVALAFTAQVLLQMGFQLIQRTLLKRTVSVERVMLVGTGPVAEHLYRKIGANPWLGQQVIGAVRIEDEASAESADLPILGKVDDLLALVDGNGIHAVYFVPPLEGAGLLRQYYFPLLDRHVSVHWVPDIFSLRLVNHSVREIAGMPVLTLSETPLIGTQRLLKTIEDVLLASVILVLIAPVMAAVALAIKLDSPGPVFFRQSRMGWNGKTFRIWKFRSMVVHQDEAGGVVQARRNDPRVTRVGAFIRRTSLDELPQLFNVLVGDMSLVGPRPHAIQHDHEYSKRIADYYARHNIKPGMTGLAQVRGFRGETQDVARMIHRIESDIEYINNWSLWLDLVILFRTVGALTGKHAY